MYKQILSFAIAAILPMASAVPLTSRQASGMLSESDVSVAQLALFLEHLEYNFYTGGYNAYSDAEYTAAGFPEGFRDLVGIIADQEKVHASILTSVLSSNGASPVPACTYKFPYSDPKSFVALGNMITTVGIGAYLGGAMSLMDHPSLLTDAAAILTVEARHDAVLRSGAGAKPFPAPFDTALSAAWAYNLALQFIESCPTYLPIGTLPKLTLASPMPAPNLQPPSLAGTELKFTWDSSKFTAHVDASTPLYIAFINQDSAPIFEKVTSSGMNSGSVAVPKGLAGVAFACLTTFSSGLNEAELTSYGTLAGPAEIALS